jgi:hypothetical protein
MQFRNTLNLCSSLCIFQSLSLWRGDKKKKTNKIIGSIPQV